MTSSECDGEGGGFTNLIFQITTLRQEMRSHFEGVDRHFDRLEEHYQAIAQALRRIEDRQAHP